LAIQAITRLLSAPGSQSFKAVSAASVHTVLNLGHGAYIVPIQLKVQR
jgi:hypothetical protein